jgi:hypothetical protein
MTRLNQVVALEVGVKQEAEKALETAKHKSALLPQMAGISRSYRPREDEGDTLPPESTQVQIDVASIIKEMTPATIRLFDLVLTKESMNRETAADVVVDGTTLLENMPVTVLLFLERQLALLKTFVAGLPVLDPAESWTEDEPGVYRTPPRSTVRTVKLPKAFVRYEATKEHPAQVDAYTEDKVMGDWETVKFSGAIRVQDKSAILDRIRRVTQAVLQAREEANSIGVRDAKMGEDVLEFIFG